MHGLDDVGDVSRVARVIATRETIRLAAAAAEVDEESPQSTLFEGVEAPSHIGRVDGALESVEDEDDGRVQ